MRRASSWKTVRRWKTSGQALILIVLTFFGLLFFLGLMIDLGQIFLAKGYLRRAADAASLAAAAQFRENRTMADMIAAADEVARMNGIAPTSITVTTCASSGFTDAQLCPKPGDMPKKLVRVSIVMDYPLTFLSLLNIYTVRLIENSTSEAASMDVVLVIDTSESMTWDGATPEERDPSVCNPDDCQPFKQVKAAADSFASEVLNKIPAEEEDRLAIVTFANGWQDPPLGTQVYLDWTNDYDLVAKPAIENMQVYDPGLRYNDGDPPLDPVPMGPVRLYDDSPQHNFELFFCPRTIWPDNPADPDYPPKPEAISACGTTDIGGGLLLAGDQFTVQKRPEALWVVVLLTDGAANATLGTREDADMGGNPDAIILPPIETNIFKDHLPLGFCPDGDWEGPDGSHPYRQYCQDTSASSRHSVGQALYDADDFARDQAMFVACPASGTMCGGYKGQGAIIFSIGLGGLILSPDESIPPVPYGAALLRYIAAVGDDGNPATDPCTLQADYSKSCGNYYYAQHGTDLEKIFEAIYSRIFTRLTM